MENSETGTAYSVPDVRAIRRRLGLAQDAFARRFGVPVRTVQEWEQGRRVPDGPGRVLLRIIERQSTAAERAMFDDHKRYAEILRDVRDIVIATLPDVLYSEKQQFYPCFWLGPRLATVGLDFWPGRARSCVLVSGTEHRWFDFEDPVLDMAQHVVDGLVGPIDPPAMTFERYVQIADHAMRSVLAGRARVEPPKGSIGGEALWRSGSTAMRLFRLSSYRLRADLVKFGEPERSIDSYLENGSAVRFGTENLATLFMPGKLT